MLAALAAVIGVSARQDSPTTRFYYEHPSYIGPVAEQYNTSEHFTCTSQPPDCVEQAKVKCDAVGWCRSFAVMTTDIPLAAQDMTSASRHGTSNEVQLYRADFNESLPGHPRWTLYSIGDTPPPNPPAPTPNQPTWDQAFYCEVKKLAFEYAKQLMPSRPLSEAFDSLRLGASCNQTFRPKISRTAPRPFGNHGNPGGGDAIIVDGLAGDDTNPGTVDRPLKTIQAGVRVATATQTRSVELRAGTYFLGGPDGEGEVSLNSGVTLSSYDNEMAVVSGGVNLTGLSWAPSAANPDILKAKLPPGLNLPALSTLFVGGRRAVRARYPNGNPETGGLHTPPNTGYLPSDSIKVTAKGVSPPCNWMNFSDAPKVPNFVYGTYLGGTMSAPWVPNYTSYWCGKWAQVAEVGYQVNASVASRWPTGDGMSGAVFTMTRGGSDVWANYQWEVASHDPTSHTLTLGRGGYQFPRAASTGYWFIENLLAELDTPSEWYLDAATETLYYYPFPNQTAGMTSGTLEVVGTQLETLISARGSQAAPLTNVGVVRLGIAHSELTYLKDYEAPTGGGYSGHRGAAVVFEGVEFPTVSGCLFDGIGGNGVLFSRYVRNAVVEDSEFRFVGDAAILQLGATPLAQPWNATGGDQPWGTLILHNYIHDIGIYGKQGAGFVQALAGRSNLTNNVIFSGPRAGVEWLDGMGGGNHFMGNLLFALNRETTDHGCTNSWDRVPYLSRDPDSGVVTLGAALNTMARNFLICDYQCTWPLDHDDGSNTYFDSYNFLVYGGAKNFLGHSKTSMHNVYVLPDGKPIEGASVVSRTGGPTGGKHCANNDGAVPLPSPRASGYNETYAFNTCILASGDTSIYAYDNCNPKALAGTVDMTANNTFLIWGPNASLDIGLTCSGENLNLPEYQQRGYDVGSTVAAAPPASVVLRWGRQLLGMP